MQSNMETPATIGFEHEEWIADSITGTSSAAGSIALGIYANSYDVTGANTTQLDGQNAMLCIPFTSNDGQWRINCRNLVTLNVVASTTITVNFLKRKK